MKHVLAVVIAAALVVIAGTLLWIAFDHEDTHTISWEKARDNAERNARYYCSMSTNTGLYSDEFENCVDQRTESAVETWERKHPDDVWD